MTHHPAPAPRRAIRNILRNFKRLNEIENADVNIEQLAKAMRANLQITRPELPDWNLTMAKNAFIMTLFLIDGASHRTPSPKQRHQLASEMILKSAKHIFFR